MSAVASRARWSEDKKQTLVSMAGRGLPAQEIAYHLGVTPAAVMSRISKNLPGRVLSWLQKDRILELHAEGARVGRIARQTGVGEDTIAMLLRSRGFEATSANVTADTPIRLVTTGTITGGVSTVKREKWTEEEIDRLRMHLAEGLSQKRICEVMNRSRDSVKGAQAAYGLHRRDLYQPEIDRRSADREAAILELRQQGLSHKMIATRLGLSKSQVARSLRGETKK